MSQSRLMDLIFRVTDCKNATQVVRRIKERGYKANNTTIGRIKNDERQTPLSVVLKVFWDDIFGEFKGARGGGELDLADRISDLKADKAFLKKQLEEKDATIRFLEGQLKDSGRGSAPQTGSQRGKDEARDK